MGLVNGKTDKSTILKQIYELNDTWKIITIVLLGSGSGASMTCVSICEHFVSKSEHELRF